MFYLKKLGQTSKLIVVKFCMKAPSRNAELLLIEGLTF